MKKFQALFFAPGTDTVVAQVCVEAEDLPDAHRAAFANVSRDYPGVDPVPLGHYIVQQVYSFAPPDAA